MKSLHIKHVPTGTKSWFQSGKWAFAHAMLASFSVDNTLEHIQLSEFEMAEREWALLWTARLSELDRLLADARYGHVVSLSIMPYTTSVTHEAVTQAMPLANERGILRFGSVQKIESR
jgi:hypothetical protein